MAIIESSIKIDASIKDRMGFSLRFRCRAKILEGYKSVKTISRNGEQN